MMTCENYSTPISGTLNFEKNFNLSDQAGAIWCAVSCGILPLGLAPFQGNNFPWGIHGHFGEPKFR